ncbi:unnamed protein product [Lepeophtheirus salmonis]|uniref:Metalloendopeptidase n=1 Tax=Lepeophtheirus salmonis TaxID=72036 RepID=A0A7R8CS77_LEPSM|nr:unnamed protein product [Lepeophtheirus salmonis]CAF2862063.1 unnamed protein product [Lepeophtheirus salmonis]
MNDDRICQILLDNHDRVSMYSRNFLLGSTYRWPNGIIPYHMDTNFTLIQKNLIHEAMQHIEASSCIKFVEYSTQTHWVNIFTGGSGCYSNLGFNPFRRRNIVHLAQNDHCMGKGTIAHELLHTLGFAHEHTRPDRDNYLEIDWSVIPVSSRRNWFRAGGLNEDPLPGICNGNFTSTLNDCYSGYRTDTFGLDYDYGSIMHYNLKAGSAHGETVMRAKQSIPMDVQIGQRRSLSSLDFKKVNAAYPC